MHASYICSKSAAVINNKLQLCARNGECLVRYTSLAAGTMPKQVRLYCGQPITTAVRTARAAAPQLQQRRTMSDQNAPSATAGADKFRLPARFHNSPPSVWTEYIQLAAEYKPLNLGQGFTDYAVPAFIRDALAEAATSSNPLMNQYTRGFGHPRLVKVLAEMYSKLTERTIDANNEVLVTVGGYEALYASIQGALPN